MNYLYTAYVVTWVVHILYLFYLSQRAARLREEALDLERK